MQEKGDKKKKAGWGGAVQGLVVNRYAARGEFMSQ